MRGTRVYRITLSEEGYEALSQIAKNEGKPMASVIREALEEHTRKRGNKVSMGVSWGGYRQRKDET